MISLEIDDLIPFLEGIVENIIKDDISKMGIKAVKDELDDKLYSMPESDYYTRTGELRNSVVSVFNPKSFKSGKREITINHDLTRKSMPSGHRSWQTEHIQNKNIPFWIDEGHGGLAKFIAINYFDSSFKKISNLAIPTFIIGFKKYGIQAYAKS